MAKNVEEKMALNIKVSQLTMDALTDAMVAVRKAGGGNKVGSGSIAADIVSAVCDPAHSPAPATLVLIREAAARLGAPATKEF